MFKTATQGAILIFISLSLGCALFGSNEDPVKKNPDIKFDSPAKPYEKSNVSSADHVWQSTVTGNTIAINSTCQQYNDLTLKKLQQNILSGVENLKVQTDNTVTFDGREAQRIVSLGTADGIPISVDLMILKKNNCTYDITYIARTKTFKDEHMTFEKFLTGFHAP